MSEGVADAPDDTDEGDPADDGPGPAEGPDAARERAERRRRLDRIFGDVLPDQTRDDQARADQGAEEANEAWLRRQVPPHHG